jgi:transcriptional regulator
MFENLDLEMKTEETSAAHRRFSGMYLPNHFTGDAKTARALMNEYPFATLISTDADGMPSANHFPLLARTTSDGGLFLEGHMAKRNSQWQHFKASGNALAIFHGPHTYITPRWYSSGRDVPTWNYVAVHASGPVKLIEDAEGLVGLLQRLSEKFESSEPRPWNFELPPDLADSSVLASAIIGFEIKIENLETKLKLSQNRPEQDQHGVIAGLATRGDEMSLAIRNLMESNLRAP